MRRRHLVLVAALLTGAVLPTVGLTAARSAPAGLWAGVAVVDATWHVGASAGQYASDRPGFPGEALADGEIPDPTVHLAGEYDPNLHQTKRRASYGVQSRLTIRALVVEGSNRERVALVKSDNYLAQDLLVRRVGQLLEGGDSGIAPERILHHASHNHSSPYYATPAWGVWLFQDVMDLRMFEFQARRMAQAIERAAASLRPARMGATVVPYGVTQRNAPGERVADDGGPAGYPREENDKGITVIRFDDVSRRQPVPLATWMNYGQHPESLEGYNLISADYLGPLERFVGRETGAPLVFSQGSVGSAEQPDDESTEVLPTGDVRAYSHAGYAQAERGARHMADAVLAGWREVGAGGGVVPYTRDVPVRTLQAWVPGPVSHPYPSVSNCRSEPTLEGDRPGVPVAGLPDCERQDNPLDEAPDEVQVWPDRALLDSLKEHGVPVPEHYDAPGFLAVEENVRLVLQAVRLGDVVLASCACEAQVDLIKNFESRANDAAGDIYDGYDWAAHCTPGAEGYACTRPNGSPLSVTPAAYDRMVAQVHNDAGGWDDPSNAVAANGEPTDPLQIKGNFTKEEIQALGVPGYRLAVGVAHAGDYNGYTVSYREYMSGDHYRKALTSYGPHTADYMVTRMVRMAAHLQGAPAPGPEPLDAVAQADEARQAATAAALGPAAAAAYDGWAATLPDDAGEPAALEQPADVGRFAAATFTWRGGNNYVDNPVARVEQRVSGRWRPYADQTGEVQTIVHWPEGAVQGQAAYRSGVQEWIWTASFEAFDYFPRGIDPRAPQVPSGRYRFVVEGLQSRGSNPVPYRIASQPFAVGPWEGIVARDLRVEGGDTSFTVDPIAYPLSYDSPVEMISAEDDFGDDNGADDNGLCFNCTFRPWARTASVATAAVLVTRANGATATVPAVLGGDGRWRADTNLRPGDRVSLPRGSVVDTYGEINGAALGPVTA